jgi:hypothetical protein
MKASSTFLEFLAEVSMKRALYRSASYLPSLVEIFLASIISLLLPTKMRGAEYFDISFIQFSIDLKL